MESVVVDVEKEDEEKDHGKHLYSLDDDDKNPICCELHISKSLTQQKGDIDEAHAIFNLNT